MVKNSLLLREFEYLFQKKEGRLSFEKAMEIFTSLRQEVKDLKIIPLKDPLEGIEVDIRIAKILNSCSKNSSQD